MTRRTRLTALLALAGCAVLAALSFGSSASARSKATPVTGGDLIIARTADSSTMDATSAFDNEAIWVFEQIMEPLYTVTPDGKDVKPWLATSYTLSQGQADLHVQSAQGRQVPQRRGDDVRGRQVLDRRRAQHEGRLGVHRRRDQERQRRGQVHRQHQDEVQVGAARRRHRALLERRSCRRTTAARRRRSSTTRPSAPARSSGTLDARQGDQVPQVRPVLAEGQAVPRQRHVDERARREHAPAAAQGRPGPHQRVPGLGAGQAAAEHARASR